MGNLELQMYKQSLRHMSTPQLKTEERKQMGAYISSMLRGDTRGAEQAKAKLEAVRSEIDNRGPWLPPVKPLPLPWKGIDTRF